MDFEHRHETFKEYLERLRKCAINRYIIDKESGRINNRTAQYKKPKKTKNPHIYVMKKKNVVYRNNN